VQGKVAVQGQERDVHRNVPTSEVIAAAMKYDVNVIAHRGG
jgi:hypothetical protein